MVENFKYCERHNYVYSIEETFSTWFSSNSETNDTDLLEDFKYIFLGIYAVA